MCVFGTLEYRPLTCPASVLPIPSETLLTLAVSIGEYKGNVFVGVSPTGIMFQGTIDELGRQVEKQRLTHDLSYNARRGLRLSVNDRVKEELLTPCIYG